jgi:hypothetical protein
MDKDPRRGEKLGWLLGWTGSFLFLPVLSIIWLVQENLGSGMAGLLLWLLAELLVLRITPWRFPDKRYWRPMLPLYVILLIAVALAMIGFGGLEGSGLRWWNMLWVLPMMTPLFVLGGRRWE